MSKIKGGWLLLPSDKDSLLNLSTALDYDWTEEKKSQLIIKLFRAAQKNVLSE